MNFEELRNSKTMTAEAISHALKVTDLSRYEEYIPTKDIGEWAFAEAIEYNKRPHCENVGKMKVLMEQARACLGEKEVEKRLSELSKDAKGK